MISIIASIQKKDRGLGYQNDLLVKVSGDLKRVKALTTGHPIIMGRKTFESIGRPLPNRTNIVITRSTDYQPEGIVVVHSLDEALEKAKEIDSEEIFIFGGGEIFKAALPCTDRLYLTLLESDQPADTFFPEYEKEFTKEIERESHTDPNSGIEYEFVTLERT